MTLFALGFLRLFEDFQKLVEGGGDSPWFFAAGLSIIEVSHPLLFDSDYYNRYKTSQNLKSTILNITGESNC